MSESVLLLAFTVKAGQVYPPKIALMNDYLKNDPLASCCSNQSQIQIFIPACIGIFHDNSLACSEIEKSLNG